MLPHVHDGDRNIGGGGWEGRSKAKKRGAVTLRGLAMSSLSISATSSVLLDHIWPGKGLVLRL